MGTKHRPPTSMHWFIRCALVAGGRRCGGCAMDKVHWFIILKSCKYSLLSSDFCGIVSGHQKRGMTHNAGDVISLSMKFVVIKTICREIIYPIPFTSCSCQSDPHRKSPPSLWIMFPLMIPFCNNIFRIALLSWTSSSVHCPLCGIVYPRSEAAPGMTTLFSIRKLRYISQSDTTI